MGRRRGQVRVGYRKLSKAYKARLVRAGVTQTQWENGADLRVARGHVPRPPRSAAPLEPTVDAVHGDADPAELAQLKQWAGSDRPAWIPEALRVDVAAILSQLPPPGQWSGVVLFPRSGGDTWTMRVEMKGNAYPVEIEIPGGGEELSGAWQILDLLSHPPNSKAWEDWSVDDFRVDRTGST